MLAGSGCGPERISSIFMALMRILVLDNYDSFTYNLVHYIEKVSDHTADVYRNDKITLGAVDAYDKILISPGPGLPRDAGILPQLLTTYAGSKDEVYHGISARIRVVKDDILFKGLPREFSVGRYHSWGVDPARLPSVLEITATDERGIIMAMRHRELKLRSVQFHPESVLTEHGETIIKNWLEM
jgi:anthranilate synthase component II